MLVVLGAIRFVIVLGWGINLIVRLIVARWNNLISLLLIILLCLVNLTSLLSYGRLSQQTHHPLFNVFERPRVPKHSILVAVRVGLNTYEFGIRFDLISLRHLSDFSAVNLDKGDSFGSVNSENFIGGFVEII